MAAAVPKEMKPGKVHRLSYEDLCCFTDNFCKSNYISHFQFGKLYRGKIVGEEWTQYVLVKIWEIPKIYNYKPGDNKRRLADEFALLPDAKVMDIPGMVKLYGYCLEGDHLGVVYDFKPFDSVYNLIRKDGFTWLQRIKVALGFASLLKSLHMVKSPAYKPFIVCNLDCAHIVIDEDYNPKLCDFGLITGGIFPDRTIFKCPHVWGSYGYIDLGAMLADEYSVKQDVYAFGVVLLNLISKSVYNVNRQHVNACQIYERALSKFFRYEIACRDGKSSKGTKFSLVHKSLKDEPSFDVADEQKISLLAIACMGEYPSERPTMKQVVKSLLKLKVVKKHRDFLGVDKLVGKLYKSSCSP